MKIGLIVVLALVIFIFFSTRNSESKADFEEKKKVSKEKLEELKKESNKDELFSVVDASKGDINNIKLLRDRYPELLLSDTKELWESIKDEVRSNYNSEVKKEIAEDFSDLREVINPEAGDIANIKTIREHYDVDLRTAKELWDSIRDDYKSQEKSAVDEYLTKEFIDEQTNKFDRE